MCTLLTRQETIRGYRTILELQRMAATEEVTLSGCLRDIRTLFTGAVTIFITIKLSFDYGKFKKRAKG